MPTPKGRRSSSAGKFPGTLRASGDRRPREVRHQASPLRQLGLSASFALHPQVPGPPQPARLEDLSASGSTASRTTIIRRNPSPARATSYIAAKSSIPSAAPRGWTSTSSAATCRRLRPCKAGKVQPLTDEDRRTICRWIDLGCPIDLDYDAAASRKPRLRLDARRQSADPDARDAARACRPSRSTAS